MEETNKLPLKRVELPLSKFNEVAIPHHLDLLRQHKANIIKYEELSEYARVRSEQVHARRVAAQLRALLAELEALRRQVRAADTPHFDRLTQRSRQLTLRAIMDYLDTSPLCMERRRAEAEAEVAGSAASTDSVGLVQLHLDAHDAEVAEREAALRGWAELQAEVRALHDAWQHMQAAALAQRDHVAAAAASTHRAADNVEAARHSLSVAERLRASAVGVGGAAVGALVGGPVGLVAGAKLGAATALAGSLLGYLGVRAWARGPAAPDPAHGDKDL